MPTLSDFMQRVVPWPSGNTDGYVNLHWKTTRNASPGKEYWAGRPTQTLQGFLDIVAWAQSKSQITDIYYCLSRQTAVGKNKNGTIKVLRLQENAVALKAIWLDVDIKDPPKGYASLGEAVSAVAEFVSTMKLPPPTALVGSGGGLHVYWISAKPLTVDEWRPYAEGLKTAALQFGLRCDAGVTTDCARVLRVPQTQNFKTVPPKPVRLLGLRADDYVFVDHLSALAALAPTVTATVRAKPAFDLTLFPKRAIPPEGIESLADGLGYGDTPPLEAKPIFKGCKFLQDALVTGGKDYTQPMWNLTTLAATFMENGNALAHKMGNRHAGYSVDSTEALWDRKNKERTSRHLGWPSCSAIQAAGSMVCGSCPHLAKRKSPLNLANVVTAVVNPISLGLVHPTIDLLLPKGYVIDPTGLICKLDEEQVKGGPPIPLLVPLFHCRITAPWIQNGPDALNFTVSTDKGNFKAVSIPMETMATPADLMRYMLRHSMTPRVRLAPFVQEFTVSWISKLRDAQKAQSSLPFGWLVENGKRRGFVYGGVIMKDDNTDSPSGFGDQEIREEYSPTGQLSPWVDALKLILDQKRPELDCIVASAFAAPLMISPGEYNVLLSVYGTTGTGKSTAMKVASAVWGHPKRTKEVTMSTSRSVVKKMGEIRNLPLYWDEIKDKKSQQNVFNSIFGTEGIGPSRLNQDASRKARTDWQTMMCICSNISFVDHVAEALRQTPAGMYRVLEYSIDKAPPNAPGQMESYTATRITQHLESNYGVMGMKYGKMLASDPYAIDAYVMQVTDAFAKEMNCVKEERNWAAAAGTLLAGAGLANELLKDTPCQFDLAAMRALLKKSIENMRTKIIDENVEGGSEDSTEGTLTSFLKDYVAETLFTDTYPMGVGKPGVITVLSAPQSSNPKPVQVQWVVKERLLRISRTKFVEWLNKGTHSPSTVLTGLRDHFKMEVVKSSLGAGTSFLCGRERVMHIPVPVGSALEAQMYAHGGAPDGYVAVQEALDISLMPGVPQAAVEQAAKDLELVRNKT